MPDLSRRAALGAATGAALVAGVARASDAVAQGAPTAPLPMRGNEGADILGPRNLAREAQNPDIVSPPNTDAGTLPNLRFSFADSHQRIEPGGWARQVTARELPVSKSIAGVNMRLKSNVVRELHWHKEAEWSYMLAGRARITAVDADGNFFIDDVGPGDLWYFPSGIPHSIQGIGDEGCEFLLVFDSGDFSEDSTFLLTDWFAHTPKDVLAKNFALPASAFDNIPKKELYIFPAPAPGATVAADTPQGAGKVPESFSHRMLAQDPFRFPGGTVRITDSKVFKASKTIAAALVEVEPGGIRELHWHPNTDEWQYYIEGTGRMTVFASQSSARTFDFAAGDVGYVPFAQGHYIENTGSTTLRFLEMFRSDHYADISARQWLALTPHALVQAHLNLPAGAVEGFPTAKTVVIKG
ncbi:oxalate decarboxylase family bicupin [Roseomonas elaeocarpi]|uniref:Oxalate decarboxylase family bicupin n=1 Tax=Roseomonas elaeocarpi TaxID=907779 RepID=A0ABV6JVW6_9PROT